MSFYSSSTSSQPVVGIDFDNTIASYDQLFHRLALEKDLISADFPVCKTRIRNHLRATGQEPLWTAMQGEAYGPRMPEAEPFCGVLDAISNLRHQHIEVRIISHKTQHPISGPRFDLHAAARSWLTERGFWATGLSETHVFFEPTKEAKLARVVSEGCSVFIDDLPEIFLAPTFPSNVKRILFDPENIHPSNPLWESLSSWSRFQQP